NIVSTPLKNPDFVKLAEAFGVKGLRAERKDQVVPAILAAMEHDGPVVVDFRVTYDENIYPMVPPGASLDETIEVPASPTDKAAKQEVKA
ncbi:MAG: acetolactate synthase large subunit, partial [Chloroflexi bacterium]|nr:acetolactate synthase large subunit [Chloroflexota bacterium]